MPCLAVFAIMSYKSEVEQDILAQSNNKLYINLHHIYIYT